jgi:hypothetical protein
MEKRPALPAKMPSGEPWPVETVRWYARWENLTALQFDELQVAALLHAEMWLGNGNASTASELRKRVSDLQHAREANLAAAAAAERKTPAKRTERPWLKEVLDG